MKSASIERRTYAADPLCAPGADPSPTSIIELKAKVAEAKAAEAKATTEAAVGGVAGGADRAVWVADASAVLQNAYLTDRANAAA